MKELENILNTFVVDYEITDDLETKEAKLSDQFFKLSKRIFYDGYFVAKNGAKIYPTDIEFYYHEEGDNAAIKDPIMYHTNDRLLDGKIIQFLKARYGKESCPYYPKCALNFHTSGVDVTFEKENEYRASFLIRGYKIIINDAVISETRPTFLYDYIFSGGFYNGMKVLRWKSKKTPCGNDPIICTRENVKQYKKANGVYIKNDKGEYIKEENKKCDRKWRFKKSN